MLTRSAKLLLLPPGFNRVARLRKKHLNRVNGFRRKQRSGNGWHG